MTVSAISILPPALQQVTQLSNSQKSTQQTAVAPSASTDSDGDNDGSGGGKINITPPVNIKA